MTILVMIPAHNEAAAIPETLKSVWNQSMRPDRCIVITDNCDDNTAALARAHGAEVFTTQGNRDKKAGALNQALEAYLPQLAEDDAVLIMDADTTLADDFLAVSYGRLETYVGGVSCVFLGRPSKSRLGMLQAMEFFRYKRQISRNGDKAFVLSGTATLFNVAALRAVKQNRGSRLPPGDSYYDIHSLTEDNEMTLAMLVLGYECPAPGVVSITDVMENPRKLFHQRQRWYLGALRNLWAYGRRLPWHMRWVYWKQQLGLTLAALGMILYLVLVVSALAITHRLTMSWVWLLPLAVLFVERVVTIWKLGWKARLLAASLVVEMLYSYFLLATFCVALLQFLRGHKGSWKTT